MNSTGSLTYIHPWREHSAQARRQDQAPALELVATSGADPTADEFASAASDGKAREGHAETLLGAAPVPSDPRGCLSRVGGRLRAYRHHLLAGGVSLMAGGGVATGMFFLLRHLGTHDDAVVGSALSGSLTAVGVGVLGLVSISERRPGAPRVATATLAAGVAEALREKLPPDALRHVTDYSYLNTQEYGADVELRLRWRPPDAESDTELRAYADETAEGVVARLPSDLVWTPRQGRGGEVLTPWGQMLESKGVRLRATNKPQFVDAVFNLRTPAQAQLTGLPRRA